MGIKRTSSEGAVKKAATLPPKRKVVALPKPVEAAVQNTVSRPENPSTAIAGKPVFTPQPDLSSELIALRAYFISEKRRVEGQDGDALGDWLEAERQLRSESRL